jgi:hypothetical protein
MVEVLIVCVDSDAAVVTQGCRLQGCTTTAACAAIQACLTDCAVSDTGFVHVAFGEGGLLHVDAFAHSKGGIAYQDKSRRPETFVNLKRGPAGQASIGLLSWFSGLSSFICFAVPVQQLLGAFGIRLLCVAAAG